MKSDDWTPMSPEATTIPQESVGQRDRRAIEQAFGRLDPVALGAAVGLVVGIGLALATAALLLQGGSWVGLHLMRLGHFLPGYAVSWPGLVIGMIDGAVVGFVVGWVTAWLWNGYHRFFIAVVLARERARAIRRELQEL